MKKVYSHLLILVCMSLAYISRSQVNFTANDFIVPYEGVYHPGINLGYYGPTWNDNTLGDLAAGNETSQTQGLGMKALRGSLPEGLGRTFTYDIWIDKYDYNNAIGTTDNTLFLGFASAEHRDPVDYCPGDDFQTDMFANLYEPIWDDGENGTPVNDENYYALYVYEVVSRLHEKVKFWEIWNEPGFDFTGAKGFLEPGQPGNWWENNPDPCDYKLRAPIFHYIRTLRISYEVIKSIAPDDYVCIAGLGFDSFLDALLRNTDNPDDGKVTAEYPLGAGAYFDVVGFHVYPHIDGTTRFWDPSINDFVFTRHSDAAADALETRQIDRQKVLDAYGYDGMTYPRKEWFATEVNVPNMPINQAWGSEEVQRNYVMKVNMKAMELDFTQIHLFVLGDFSDEDDAQSEFNLMGSYKNLFGIGPGQEVVKESGIGMKTLSDALFGSRYDPAQTAAMNLPDNIGGGAYRFEDGTYTYALWAKTQNDLSENVSAIYSFPTPLSLSTLIRREWDFSRTGNRISQNANNISLSAAPIFLRPTQDDPDVSLEVSCNMDIEIKVTATTPEGGAVVSWPIPTATTNCPGGVTIEQTQGIANGGFFPFGVHEMQYTITNACGQQKLCAFNVAVASTGGGIGDCNLFRWEMGFVGQYKGNKYFVSKVKKNFVDAQTQAAGHGGYLVSIDSPEENEFLRQQVNTLAMIGYNDLDVEGNLEWTSGKEVVYTNVADCQGCQNSDFGDVAIFNHFNGEWFFVGQDAVEYFIMELPCGEIEECICTTEFDPVCAPDGQLYSNSCFAECAGVLDYSFCVEDCDLSQQEWLQDTLANTDFCEQSCLASIESFVFNDTTFVFFNAQNGICTAPLSEIYSCDGTLICTEGSIAGLTECTERFGSLLSLTTETFWTREDCETPCNLDEQVWLDELIANVNCNYFFNLTISTFTENGNIYVLVDDGSSPDSDGGYVVYDCMGNIFCTEAGFGFPLCTDIFESDFLDNLELIWSAVEMCGMPCDLDRQDWLQDTLANTDFCNESCLASIGSFVFNDSTFVFFDAQNGGCSDPLSEIYSCVGTLICTEGSIAGLTECTDRFGYPLPLVTETFWTREDCEAPCNLEEQDWLQDTLANTDFCGQSCLVAIGSFVFNDTTFVFFDAHNGGCTDPLSEIYSCDGTLICTEGSIAGLTECTDRFGNPMASEMFWTREDCEVPCNLEEQDWLDELIANSDCSNLDLTISTFTEDGSVYVLVDDGNGAVPDGGFVVYDCLGNIFCTEAGFGAPLCSDMFESDFLDNLELIWSAAEMCGMPCDLDGQDWLQDTLSSDAICANSCLESIYAFEDAGVTYVAFINDEDACGTGVTNIYTCTGELFCQEGSIAYLTECSDFFGEDIFDEGIELWSPEQCPAPCTLDGQAWLENKLASLDCEGCVASVETFVFNNESYVIEVRDSAACDPDGYSIVDCDGFVVCIEGGVNGSTDCSNSFGSLENVKTEVLWAKAVDCLNTSISVLHLEALTLYPNPTQANINLSFEGVETRSLRIDILDVLGKSISHMDYDSVAGSNNILLNTNGLAEGMYFIQVSDKVNASVRLLKFVKI